MAKKSFPLSPAANHAANRARLIAQLNKQGVSSGVVVVEGGKLCTRYNSDADVLFRQEANFLWISGSVEADQVVAVDVAAKTCTLFIPKLPADFAIWMGAIESTEEVKAKYGVEDVQYTEDLAVYLAKFDKQYVHGDFSAPAGTEAARVDSAELKKALLECRMYKSEGELAIMQQINDISSRAHEAMMRAAKPSGWEYQMESVFLHECYKQGIRHQAYISIVAAGKYGSFLHYGNNDKEVKDGDMLLVDAGGELHGFSSDITRTYPVNGKFTDDQRAVYSIVLDAQKKLIDMVGPDVDYTDIHTAALRFLGEGLIKHDFIRGDIDELLAKDIVAIFFPHGVGHMIGMDTHDVGGYPDGVERIARPSYRFLRCRRVLKPGMVVTIEPGVYFIDALLEPALADAEVAKYLNVEKIARFRDFGGVRIEDDIIVTESGYRNLTTAVKEIDDVEAMLAKPYTE